MSETPELGDWTPSELEKNGVLALARIRDLLNNIRTFPVAVNATPEEVQGLLEASLPTAGDSFETILDDTWDRIIPYLTLWHHPSFHGYFSNSSSGPGIVAEMIASALNVNSMSWVSSPAASALEALVLRWLCEIIDYARDSDGVLVSGASLGTFYSLNAARDYKLDIDVRNLGLSGRADLRPLRIYATDQAHSSVDKAAIALGIGLANIVRIRTDSDYAMDPSHLAECIRRDRRGGFTPLAVVATDGTTSTAAHDPIKDISAVCRDNDVWLHVDAAYGGLWRLAPDFRAQAEPLSVADSVVVNPHKTLFVPMECSALFCKHNDALTAAFRLVPEYLSNPVEFKSVDYMDRSLQLGRSFRAFKLWWVIRSFGIEGLSARLTRLMRLGDLLRSKVDSSPVWERIGGSPLPLLCVRYIGDKDGKGSQGGTVDQGYLDELNIRIMNRVNAAGSAFISKTKVSSGVVLRISIGNIQTRQEDILMLWDQLGRAASWEAEHCSL
ncbi:pyridoxal-dependent decarboxylase [Mycobacterium sp. 852002-40037_SCH5390672]|uniref:pyridoxal phosphate-dependent decarboxylase family protein n=1 Tax=Mycobacterium sp. 852002-40037_SCH5390672 TaxID=1834089 RepID=UPI0008052216|nr:pyridoxal-dependent decarboxylase [Mycobacterium sp. 852002-40037_SCH5390672]OBB94647.1 hypothetical protein A5782_09060 [Mycobacterium sp. 852002-40037_SCH5390672]